jgi:hypothetical protein
MAAVLVILLESIQRYLCSPQHYLALSRQGLRHLLGIPLQLQTPAM